MCIHSFKVSNAAGVRRLIEVSQRFFATIPGAEFVLTLRSVGTEDVIKVAGSSLDDITVCLRILALDEGAPTAGGVRFDLHVFRRTPASALRARRYRSRQDLDSEVANMSPLGFTGYPDDPGGREQRAAYLLQLILDHFHLTPWALEQVAGIALNTTKSILATRVLMSRRTARKLAAALPLSGSLQQELLAVVSTSYRGRAPRL